MAHGPVVHIKTSPVKQYSYENDFSGVFDALHQSFLVYFVIKSSPSEEMFGTLATHKAPSEDSDQSIPRVHSLYCLFCHALAYL